MKSILLNSTYIRSGIFVFVCVTVYKVLLRILNKKRPNDKMNSMIAGGIAGFSVLILDKKERREISMNIFVRSFFNLNSLIL